MIENTKKLLEITLVLTSDNTFNIEVYEPESGEFKIINCNDNGALTENENKQITSEIRSWISLMREELQE